MMQGSGEALRRYQPMRPVLEFQAFPPQLKLIAERMVVRGNGTQEAPLRMAWIVRPSRFKGGRKAMLAESKTWLKESGFVANGQRWEKIDE
ncbi:hypothetical protein ACW0US_18080 [Xanthomonas euvesicatoria]